MSKSIQNINMDERHFVHPDTIVITKRGPKKISSVTTGDQVVNAYGQYKPVGDVMKVEYNGSLVDVDGTQMHEHHGLLAIKAHDPLKSESMRYINSIDLEEGDYVVSVIPKESTDLPGPH